MAHIQVQKLHESQRRVVAEAKRFNVLMCGRRFGKTTLGIDRVVETRQVWCAPWSRHGSSSPPGPTRHAPRRGTPA